MTSPYEGKRGRHPKDCSCSRHQEPIGRKTALRLDAERNSRDLANERWADKEDKREARRGRHPKDCSCPRHATVDSESKGGGPTGKSQDTGRTERSAAPFFAAKVEEVVPLDKSTVKPFVFSLSGSAINEDRDKLERYLRKCVGIPKGQPIEFVEMVL